MYKAILLKQNGNARATFIYINYKLYSPRFKKSNPFYEKWLFFLALSTIIKLVLSKFHNKIRLLYRPATRMVQRKEVIMKFLKQNSVNLLISLCELIIGILLLIDPTGFSNGIIIAFGAACLAFGIVQIVFYWKKPLAEAISRFYLMKGLISISVGLFCICFSHWFLETFKLLSFLYGILLLISGFYKVQWSIDLLRQKEKRWWLAAVSAGLSILFSLIIIGNPFSTVTVTWIFSGVVLIAEAIIDIVMLLLIRVFVNAKFPKIKKKEKSVSDDSVQQADTSSQPTSSESSNDSNETP